MNEMSGTNWFYRLLFSLLILFLLLIFTVVFSITLGSAAVTPWTALKVLFSYLTGGTAFIHSGVDPAVQVIILQIRLPRVILALFVGAALSTAGAALQGFLRNPLADPYTLGVSSGAAVGAAFTLIILRPGSTLAAAGLPLAAFLGALVTGVLVYYLAQIEGYLAVETLILAGVIMSSFMSAILSYLLTVAGENLHQIIYWLMGNLALRGSEYLIYTLPYLVGGITLICFFGRELNIMTFGEETAGQLGVAVEKTKRILLLLATLLTGIAVALAGTIGFVGLIVPHLVRLLLGPDHRVLLPVSAVGGGIFLIWADTIARTMLAPVELPVGVVTAFLGAPFFVYLLRTRKRRGF
ncbi:MAG: iron chelate uptake ABC transporter family permease subunit [Firmicutes bacterium]|nr:iron chelate uptake ABC transporter family permease subunit [Bacillota bacterium]